MNPEHMEIARLGKEVIEAWRKAHPYDHLDLSWANLSNGFDLAGANLGGCDLHGANFGGINLTRARLRGAYLSWANLSGSCLRGSDLHQANLVGANLTRADLRESNLFLAVLNTTILDHAQLAGATFGQTMVSNCDLSLVMGLELVNHIAPSSIGLDTMARSRGNIPKSFMRDAGIPEAAIAYLPSMFAEPIQFYTCFISYSSRDQALADRLYTDLRAKDVRCWYYPVDAAWGRRVREDIEGAIGIFDKLIVICSESSLTSPAVLEEVERALHKENTLARENAHRMQQATTNDEQPQLKDQDVLFPIRIDNYIFDRWQHQLKSNVITRNIGDFVGWEDDAQKYTDSLHRLIQALDPKSWPTAR